MSTPTLDETRATAFAQRMAGTLNDAFLAFMVSIGHQTDLFDKQRWSGQILDANNYYVVRGG